jgi:two-component system sensor histidine kinase ChvG
MAARPWYKRLPFGQSRLGRAVLGVNIFVFLILVGGVTSVDTWRQGLIDAYKSSLTVQAQLLGRILDSAASGEEATPELDVQYANLLLGQFVPAGTQRVRLFNAQGFVVSDSYVVSESVDVHDLPAARKASDPPPPDKSAKHAQRRAEAAAALHEEVVQALQGETVTEVRPNEFGVKVVSVSIPIRRVKAVLGVLTVEGGDFDKTVEAQREAMIPFVLVAMAVTIFSSLLLNWLVSRPIQRLSAAADTVRANQARAISLPDLEARKDEIGTLARSLESMTDTLWRRMEEIDRFAADVAHEIKNPLTSIRSALETLSIVKDEAAKTRLMNVLTQDVRRLDRLITDISNASRLDAELSRDVPRPIDAGSLLEDIISVYQQGGVPGAVHVAFDRQIPAARVNGREGPLGQVFRNLIDNARSFSPEGGEVRVTLGPSSDASLPLKITVEDDGPGIPPENLETIFQRFYTSRPKGTRFGQNSGLGLSISRQIIEAHHGKVWAENRTDKDGRLIGAKFTILLPEGV